MPINPKEIRIGNKIFEKVLGECTIVGIQENYIGVSNGDETGVYSISPENLHPIPVTSELLSGYGFEKTKYGGEEQWLSPYTERSQPYTKLRIGIINNPVCGFQYQTEIITTPIKHFHQLQNLYWFLIEEELINETR